MCINLSVKNLSNFSVLYKALICPSNGGAIRWKQSRSSRYDQRRIRVDCGTLFFWLVVRAFISYSLTFGGRKKHWFSSAAWTNSAAWSNIVFVPKPERPCAVSLSDFGLRAMTVSREFLNAMSICDVTLEKLSRTFDPSRTIVANNVDSKWKFTVQYLYRIVEMLDISARIQCVD